MTYGLTCFAQNQKIVKELEKSYPIKTAKDFDNLRPAIQQLASHKQDDFYWSPELLKTLESAKTWAENHGTIKQELLARYFLLIYYDNHLEDNLVIDIGEKLLTIPEFMEMPESVHSLLALKSSYRRKGYYQQQLNILNILIEQNAKFEYIVWPETYEYYNELALVYYNLGQYSSARNNFIKQSEVFLNADDFFRASSMFNNIGLTYAKQEKTDSALIFYEKAIQILDRNDLKDHYFSSDYIAHFKNVVKSNIVKVNKESVSFSEKERVFMMELASSKAVKEPNTTAQVYQNLSELYYNNNTLKLAENYIDSTLIFEKSFRNPANREKAYLLKAKISLAQNQNEKALNYFELSQALNDSLNKAKDEKNYAEATAKFNFVKTGEALEENKKLLQQKVEANQVQLIFLCVVILLMLLIGFMLFKSTKANSLIANQKDALQKGLKEKGIMLDEIHHRIKNNLQVVSGILELQRGKVDSKKHAKIYEESQAYLQSMSMIHELLYEQEGVSKLDMQAYFKKLGHLLIDSYPNINIGYNVSAPTVQLDVKKATPLALIICELITNSLKHAFDKAGTIVIKLTKNDELYILDYTDSGSGFENINNSNYYNTGLNLILMLVEDLDGTVKFANNNGFNCNITFTD